MGSSVDYPKPEENITPTSPIYETVEVDYSDFDKTKLSFSPIQIIKMNNAPLYKRYYVLYDGKKPKLKCPDLFTEHGTRDKIMKGTRHVLVSKEGERTAISESTDEIIDNDTNVAIHIPENMKWVKEQDKVIGKFICFKLDKSDEHQRLKEVLNYIQEQVNIHREYNTKTRDIISINKNGGTYLFVDTKTVVEPGIIETPVISINSVMITNLCKTIKISY